MRLLEIGFDLIYTIENRDAMSMGIFPLIIDLCIVEFLRELYWVHFYS